MLQRIRTRLRGGGQGPWVLAAAIAVALLQEHHEHHSTRSSEPAHELRRAA